MKSVGIDIGSYSIKVAEVEAGGKTSGALIAYGEHPINPDPRADRALEIIETLRKIASLYDPATTRFTVAIPQNEVSVRFKRFPFKDRNKILKSLAFELEDEIPLDLDESIFEAKICEFLGETANVLTLAAHRDSVEDALTRARDGGLDPEIVTAEGFALANIFEQWSQPPPSLPAGPDLDEIESSGPPPLPQDARIVLHLGHTRSILLCYREGVLIDVRSIVWGGSEIAEALAKTFGVTYLEGVNILKRKSFILMNSAGASRDQIVLSKAVSTEVDNLVRDVRLSLLDLKTQHNVAFSQIDLIGGVSQIQNIAPYLTQMLEVPANVYHYLQTLRHVRIENAPGLEATSPTAVGLALEGAKKIRNPATNFRKGEFARQNKSLQILWEKWRPAVITASIAFALFSVFSLIRSSMADSLAIGIEEQITEQAKVAQLPKGYTTPAGVRKYVKETDERVKTRAQLEKLDGYENALDVLLKVVNNIPVGQNIAGAKVAVGIRRLDIDNNRVLIEGQVNNRDHVAQVRKALAQLAVDKKVQEGSVSATGPGVPFAFEFNVNRLSAK